MRPRRFWWWFWYAAVVAVLMNSLSEFIGWLDGLPSGQQALVTSGILLTVPALAGSAAWLGRAVVRFTVEWRRRSVDAAEAEYRRLTPQRKMTIFETYEIEPKASIAVTSSLNRISDLRDGFVAVMGKWPQQLNTASGQSKAAEQNAIDVQAGKLSRFSEDLTREIEELQTASGRLSDAWSSRMYWHDLRGSAGDIQGASKEMVKDLLAMTRRNSGSFSEFVGSFSACEGLTPNMDNAVEQYKVAARRLVVANRALETLYGSVLMFQRQHTGLRGVLRRMLKRNKGTSLSGFRF